MLAELKSKSQVTIPASIVKEMGLSRGDMFEVVTEGNVIKLVPVVVYPKEKAKELERLASEARGETNEVYASADDALAALHETAQ